MEDNEVIDLTRDEESQQAPARPAAPLPAVPIKEEDGEVQVQTKLPKVWLFNGKKYGPCPIVHCKGREGHLKPLLLKGCGLICIACARYRKQKNRHGNWREKERQKQEQKQQQNDLRNSRRGAPMTAEQLQEAARLQAEIKKARRERRNAEKAHAANLAKRQTVARQQRAQRAAAAQDDVAAQAKIEELQQQLEEMRNKSTDEQERLRNELEKQIHDIRLDAQKKQETLLAEQKAENEKQIQFLRNTLALSQKQLLKARCKVQKLQKAKDKLGSDSSSESQDSQASQATKRTTEEKLRLKLKRLMQQLRRASARGESSRGESSRGESSRGESSRGEGSRGEGSRGESSRGEGSGTGKRPASSRQPKRRRQTDDDPKGKRPATEGSDDGFENRYADESAEEDAEKRASKTPRKETRWGRPVVKKVTGPQLSRPAGGRGIRASDIGYGQAEFDDDGNCIRPGFVALSDDETLHTTPKRKRSQAKYLKRNQSPPAPAAASEAPASEAPASEAPASRQAPAAQAASTAAPSPAALRFSAFFEAGQEPEDSE